MVRFLSLSSNKENSMKNTLLVLLSIVCLASFSDAKMGKSYWMEDVGEAYYDMGVGKGLDVTKTEWQIERVSTIKSKGGKKKGVPKMDGKCTVRFLSSKDNMETGNLVLFSTGEIGEWSVKNPINIQQQQQGGGASLVNLSYDNAIRSTTPSIEIEVSSSDSLKDRSCVVYSFPIGAGSIQPLAVLAKSKGSVKYYPNGRSSPLIGESYGVGSGQDYSDAGSIEVGTASMHLKGGKPLVDPAWAKGRRWFWTHREVKGMGKAGYI